MTEVHGEPSSGMRSLARTLLPAPVRPTVRRLYHLVRSRAEMLALRQVYRKRYGRGFVYTLDERDEMYRFMRRPGARDLVVPIADPCYAPRAYLTAGEMMLSDLEDTLQHLGRSIRTMGSFLDFASGHGRLTRFLVHRLDRRRITVSDINKSAVDFTVRTFGVNGFYSVESADDLAHDLKYDVVFVASLFSHLSYGHWEAWLRRLYSLLNVKGLLMFSTHGPHVLRLLGDRGLETPADGFFFRRENETSDRLPTEYYGSTFVTEAYVRRVVVANALGKLAAIQPVKLWRLQDLYVLEKV